MNWRVGNIHHTHHDDVVEVKFCNSLDARRTKTVMLDASDLVKLIAIAKQFAEWQATRAQRYTYRAARIVNAIKEAA